MAVNNPKISPLAQRIEAQLVVKGINQADLVRSSGISQSMLNHLRGGRVGLVDCIKIFNLADALDCDARWLATGKHKK